MWDKIKEYFMAAIREEEKPSLTRLFLTLSFLLAWVAFFVAMFFAIQNSDKIISALSTIITSIIGLKSLQSSVKNVMDSVYNSAKGEKPNG